jgi:hypothetical protein
MQEEIPVIRTVQGCAQVARHVVLGAILLPTFDSH